MGSKKIRKIAAKFDLGHQIGKKMGLPDPSGDLLYGADKALSPAEQAQKNAMDLAKQQAAQAEQQMQMQIQAANQAAEQSAQMTANSAVRDKLAADLAEQQQVTTEAPTVTLADTATPATTAAKRKLFRGQIGGTKSGPSVRV